jgi:hypothetical protein
MTGRRIHSNLREKITRIRANPTPVLFSMVRGGGENPNPRRGNSKVTKCIYRGKRGPN